MSQFNATDIPLFIKMGFEVYNWIRLDNYITIYYIHVYKVEQKNFELIYTIMIIERRLLQGIF